MSWLASNNVRHVIRAIDGFVPLIATDVFLADNVAVLGQVRVGSRTTIWYGAVLRADAGIIDIDEDCAILDNACLRPTPREKTLLIEKWSCIGHGCIIQGCKISEGVLVGHGCTVLDGAEIGARSVIGAGTVVPAGFKVEPGVLARGRPIRIVRKLTDDELQGGSLAVRHQQEMAARHQ